MRNLIHIACAFAVLLLSGCANTPKPMPIQPIMSAKQAPATDSSYVAGMFSRKWELGKLGCGLGIVNTATAEEYVMPFGAVTRLSNDVVDEVAMIQLPPGEYRIAYWLTYSTDESQPITRTDVAADSLTGRPFKTVAGEVIFLGSYETHRENDAEGKKVWTVHHVRITPRLAQRELSYKYPAFATQPLACPSCLK
ncbi:MAG: hypothetical protein HZB95_05225 [Nitrosomonadales bacterium]|nr:hypothetical protein [Nitrosomonadales bacterium]